MRRPRRSDQGLGAGGCATGVKSFDAVELGNSRMQAAPPAACRCRRPAPPGRRRATGSHAGAEVAELIRHSDEQRIHRADAPAHLVGRFELHQRLSDHDADRIGGPENHQRRHRQPKFAGDREHHGRQSETGHRRNMMRPTRRVKVVRDSATMITSAPIAGAARSRPSPSGPISNTSLANIGSSAVAPPRAPQTSPMRSRRARSDCGG